MISCIFSEIVQHFDEEKLIHHSISCYRTIKEQLESEIIKIKQDLNGIIEEIFLGFDDYSIDLKQNPLFKQKQLLQQDYQSCLEQIRENQEALQKNKSVIKIMESALNAKVESLLIKKAQLEEELSECDNKDYIVTLRGKLSDLLNLKDLTPQLLNSLVEEVTCQSDGTIHIDTALRIHCKNHEKATPVRVSCLLLK